MAGGESLYGITALILWPANAALALAALHELKGEPKTAFWPEIQDITPRYAGLIGLLFAQGGALLIPAFAGAIIGAVLGGEILAILGGLAGLAYGIYASTRLLPATLIYVHGGTLKESLKKAWSLTQGGTAWSLLGAAVVIVLASMIAGIASLAIPFVGEFASALLTASMLAVIHRKLEGQGRTESR